MIYLPHHEGFWEYLHSRTPPGWGEDLSCDRVYFAPDANGILQRIDEENLEDHWEQLSGGENFWDGENEFDHLDGENLDEEEAFLWLPY